MLHNAVMRAALITLALLFAGTASSAHAAPSIALRDDPSATGLALAGPDVVVVRGVDRGQTQVIAVPRAGGAARTLLDVRSTSSSAFEAGAVAASPQRVAVLVS